MSRKKRKKQKPLVQLVLPTHPMPQGNQSEVGRLLRQINQEYQSAQWGLSGLAYGVSQHAFITGRMEGMERAREQLVELVGPDESTRLVVEQMNKSDEAKES